MTLTDAIWFIFWVSVADALFIVGIIIYYGKRIVRIPFRHARWHRENVLEQIQELKYEIWKIQPKPKRK